MEILSSIVKNLVVIILLASFLEVLVPDSNVRPFVRFAIGLFIILAVLNPVVEKVYRTREVKTLAWDLPMNVDVELKENYWVEGRKINKQIERAGYQALESKLEQQVKALGVLVPGVCNLKTDLEIEPGSGKIVKAVLTVSKEVQPKTPNGEVEVFSHEQSYRGKEEREIKEKLGALLQNFYGLSPEQVIVRFEGE